MTKVAEKWEMSREGKKAHSVSEREREREREIKFWFEMNGWKSNLSVLIIHAQPILKKESLFKCKTKFFNFFLI
jgi:hypothetical protein